MQKCLLRFWAGDGFQQLRSRMPPNYSSAACLDRHQWRFRVLDPPGQLLTREHPATRWLRHRKRLAETFRHLQTSSCNTIFSMASIPSFRRPGLASYPKFVILHVGHKPNVHALFFFFFFFFFCFFWGRGWEGGRVAGVCGSHLPKLNQPRDLLVSSSQVLQKIQAVRLTCKNQVPKVNCVIQSSHLEGTNSVDLSFSRQVYSIRYYSTKPIWADWFPGQYPFVVVRG